MKNKILASVLLSSLIVVAFSGCSSTQPSQPYQMSQEQKNKLVEQANNSLQKEFMNKGIQLTVNNVRQQGDNGPFDEKRQTKEVWLYAQKALIESVNNPNLRPPFTLDSAITSYSADGNSSSYSMQNNTNFKFQSDIFTRPYLLNKVGNLTYNISSFVENNQTREGKRFFAKIRLIDKTKATVEQFVVQNYTINNILPDSYSQIRDIPDDVKMYCRLALEYNLLNYKFPLQAKKDSTYEQSWYFNKKTSGNIQIDDLTPFNQKLAPIGNNTYVCNRVYQISSITSNSTQNINTNFNIELTSPTSANLYKIAN